MKYQPYPCYVEFRKVPGMTNPKDWKMIPLRWFLRVGSGDFLPNVELEMHKDAVMNMPVIGGNGVMAYTNKTNTPENSIVIGRVGAHCGNVHLIEEKSWVTDNALRIYFNNSELYPRYLFWALKALRLNDWANKNAQPLITGEIVKDKYIHYPSIKEQKMIAGFLDFKTQQFDQLIEKKKALIEKLNEQRIAVITQAVTKGLNKKAKMKSSGVDWLGDVPMHWEVKAIKRLSMVCRGASPRPIQDPKYFDDEGEYAWVRIADVTANDHYLSNTTQCLSDIGKSFSVPLEPGTLFLSIAGSVGKPMITSIKCCIHDGFVYFPHLTDNPEYLYYIFLSSQCYLGLGKLGTQLNLNTDTVGAIKIGVPSTEEQAAIVDLLHKEMKKIDRMVETVNTAIALLEEYRSTLITDAVTGKIDVRDMDVKKDVT